MDRTRYHRTVPDEVGRPRPARSRRHRGDDGVAMVEFAIIMPVLFMLVFGMLTGGIVMNRQMSLTHATREAARYGATVPVDQTFTGETWASHVRDVAVDRSGGELADANICVALMEGSSLMPGTASHWSTTGAPCIDDDIDTGRRVQVTATLPGQEINGVIIRIPLTLTSDATAKHEE